MKTASVSARLQSLSAAVSGSHFETLGWQAVHQSPLARQKLIDV